METIIQTLLPLMLLIGVGALLKITVATEEWVHVLNKLAVYILFPALIFSGMMKVDLQSIEDFSFLTVNFLLLLTIITTLKIGLTLLGLTTRMVNTYVIAVFFGNVGYLGYPIITALIPGSDGVVSIHVAIYTFLLFTVGIGILELSVHQRLDISILKETLKNPLLLSVLLSILILATDIKLPYVIEKSITLLAGGATPIILISLGIFLMRPISKSISIKHLIGLIGLKLFVIPMIFFLYFMLNPSQAIAISVLEAGMPIAITPFILAELYPMERELIALGVIISSILAMVTLPMMMVWVGVV